MTPPITAATNRLDTVVSQFRQYDQGVRDWVVQGLPVNVDGKTVPVVTSTPDRAFAAMQHLLKELRGEVVKDLRNIPLPFVSINRSSVLPDPARFHGANAYFRHLARSPESPPKSTYITQFPLPYDIAYQIEVWAKNQDTLNAFSLWAATQFKFGFETFVPIDLTAVWEGWKIKLIPFENEGMRSTGEVEPEEGHRVLRFTLQLTAKGWILADIETVKTVLEIFTDLYVVEDSGVNLAAATTSEVDNDPNTYRPEARITTTATGETIQNF